MASKLVLVLGSVHGTPHSYYVSREQADIMLARGTASESPDGRRAIVECRQSPRMVKVTGDRHWRKVTNRTRNGAAKYSTMQLVVGAQPGRNTGGRAHGR